MIAAIMQPYFFPYIGYFQLMHAVDVFVFLDDVQYIDRGWVNRNRIRDVSGPRWLTLPVRKANRELWINQREYLLGNGQARREIEGKLKHCYRGATYFEDAMQIVSDAMSHENGNVAIFNAKLLVKVAKRMGIECDYVYSSEIPKPPGLRAQAKIIDICKRIGATRYVNPIGGVDLYDASSFESDSIELSFIKTTLAPAKIADGVCFLSIIDDLMTRGVVGSSEQLARHEILFQEGS